MLASTAPEGTRCVPAPLKPRAPFGRLRDKGPRKSLTSLEDCADDGPHSQNVGEGKGQAPQTEPEEVRVEWPAPPNDPNSGDFEAI
ncbi:hypothetical protein GCM10009799_30990 [Nocardiopsis rhodophaea]|uniref:Uncharacterized protein n=1 Tax=Nocardiopsis rhodophaea TaxID=280238 RepID=A0ABN2TAJ4_9ACTN